MSQYTRSAGADSRLRPPREPSVRPEPGVLTGTKTFRRRVFIADAPIDLASLPGVLASAPREVMTSVTSDSAVE